MIISNIRINGIVSNLSFLNSSMMKPKSRKGREIRIRSNDHKYAVYTGLDLLNP